MIDAIVVVSMTAHALSSIAQRPAFPASTKLDAPHGIAAINIATFAQSGGIGGNIHSSPAVISGCTSSFSATTRPIGPGVALCAVRRDLAACSRLWDRTRRNNKSAT